MPWATDDIVFPPELHLGSDLRLKDVVGRLILGSAHNFSTTVPYACWFEILYSSAHKVGCASAEGCSKAPNFEVRATCNFYSRMRLQVTTFKS
jgi:hypothetical protein